MSRLYPNRAPRILYANAEEIRENPKAVKIPLDPKSWWLWPPIFSRSRSAEMQDILYSAYNTLMRDDFPVGSSYTYQTSGGRALLLSTLYQALKLYRAATSDYTYSTQMNVENTAQEPTIFKNHPLYGWGDASTHLPSFVVHGVSPTIATALNQTSPPPTNSLSPATFIVTKTDSVQAEEKLRMLHAIMAEEDMKFAPNIKYNRAIHLLKRLRALIDDDPSFKKVPFAVKQASVVRRADGIWLHTKKDIDPKARVVDDLEREFGFAAPRPLVRTTEIKLDMEWQPEPPPQPSSSFTSQPYIYEISIREEEDLQEAFGTSTPEIIAHLAQTPSLEELVGQWGPDILDILSPETLDRLPAQDDPYALDQIISASDLTTP